MAAVDPFSTHDDQEHARLSSLAGAYDTATTAHLMRLGADDERRCLEVGAGAGSIARWLHDRGCEVTAIDLNTTFLGALPSAIDVAEADICRFRPDPVYDLVHARFLLDVVADLPAALDAMVGALRPGGKILIEEFDDVTADAAITTRHGLHDDVVAAKQLVWTTRGLDNFLGRRVMPELAQRGLTGLGAEGHLHLRRGGTPDVAPWRRSVIQLQTAMLETGRVDASDLDAYLKLLDDPDFYYFSPLVVATWGTAP